LAAAYRARQRSLLLQTAARIPRLASRNGITLEDLVPHYVNQWNHLHRTDACDFFRELASTNPASPSVLNNLAWFLAVSPGWNPASPDEVLAIASRAASLLPDQPVILDTLAAAFANASDFPAAIETASRALALAGSDAPLAAKIRSHLECYGHSSPFRE
jgi:Tfp pilus assembly protein PilF